MKTFFFLKSQRHEYAGHVLIEKKPLQIKGKEKKQKQPHGGGNNNTTAARNTKPPILESNG
jgi:hypothetical protein